MTDPTTPAGPPAAARKRDPKPRKDGKPKRQLSERELDQRRWASKLGAAKATGPKTPEGKAISSRNAWKTGASSKIHQVHFENGLGSLVAATGKPCLTTCPKYPCSLVVDEVTRAGGSCLDKQVYVQAFGAIIDAVQSGSMDGVHGLMAAEVSAALQMLHDLRSQIAEQGFVIPIPAITSEGQVITRKDGSEVIAKYVSNPGYGMVMKTLETLGINLPELLVTPKSQAAAKVDVEKVDAMQTLLGGIFQRGARPTSPGGVLPHGEG